MGCVTVKLEAVNGVDDSKSPAAEPIYAEMLVNGSPVKFHIDSEYFADEIRRQTNTKAYKQDTGHVEQDRIETKRYQAAYDS